MLRLIAQGYSKGIRIKLKEVRAVSAEINTYNRNHKNMIKSMEGSSRSVGIDDSQKRLVRELKSGKMVRKGTR